MAVSSVFSSLNLVIVLLAVLNNGSSCSYEMIDTVPIVNDLNDCLYDQVFLWHEKYSVECDGNIYDDVWIRNETYHIRLDVCAPMSPKQYGNRNYSSRKWTVNVAEKRGIYTFYGSNNCSDGNGYRTNTFYLWNRYVVYGQGTGCVGDWDDSAIATNEISWRQVTLNIDYDELYGTVTTDDAGDQDDAENEDEDSWSFGGWLGGWAETIGLLIGLCCVLYLIYYFLCKGAK